jgi:sister-chromatid-cohesion protein PDS5
MKPSKGGFGQSLKTADRKRKSSSKEHDLTDDEKPAKRVKRASALPVRKASAVGKTPKAQKKRKSDEAPTSEVPSRKSARKSSAAAISYADRDSDEDDAEMLEVEKASTKKSQAKVEQSTLRTEKADGAKVGPEQADNKKENEAQDPDEEVNGNADVDEMDVEPSSREPSPSPLQAKTNGLANKSKKGALPKAAGRSNRIVSGNNNGNAVAEKSAGTKKVTPLKKNREPVANVRETRRTRATA